ncbi:MAG: endonuclease/exonuclease/phosphatase family protein, partial [Thermomicrobiales bacterium]
MPLTILFWNVRKNDGCRMSLVRLAKAEQVDVFLLAEAMPDLVSLVGELNLIGQGSYYEASPGLSGKVIVVSRQASANLELRRIDASEDMSIWRVAMPSAVILLAAVHLPAPLGGVKETDQHYWAQKLAEQIAATEDSENCKATVLIGDLNMNPFHQGVVSATGLHGLMTRDLARRPERVHRGQEFRRFYNPMWGLFGDRTDGPAGTYFLESSAPSNHHWHILDQVLLRSELVDRLLVLSVLDSDRVESLLKNERP